MLLLNWILGADPVHGVVVEVLPAAQQVIIAHDDIDGLMPAMTMNMSVASPELLNTLSAGDIIDFEFTVVSGRGKITAAEIVGRQPVPADWVRTTSTLVGEDPAPAFDLIDHASRRITLADLAGKTLLLDFIFTRCPGPCPILTSRNVAVERLLSDTLRLQTHFVSISIDPEDQIVKRYLGNDTAPEVIEAALAEIAAAATPLER